jgi:hypothetical protein
MHILTSASCCVHYCGGGVPNVNFGLPVLTLRVKTLYSKELHYLYSTVNIALVCMFNTLNPLASSDSVLTSETVNHFRYFGRTPWTKDRPIRNASTYTGQHNTEKRGHTSVPRAGFEPTISVFERSKIICVQLGRRKYQSSG